MQMLLALVQGNEKSLIEKTENIYLYLYYLLVLWHRWVHNIPCHPAFSFIAVLYIIVTLIHGYSKKYIK